MIVRSCALLILHATGTGIAMAIGAHAMRVGLVSAAMNACKASMATPAIRYAPHRGLAMGEASVRNQTVTVSARLDGQVIHVSGILQDCSARNLLVLGTKIAVGRDTVQ